MDEFKARGLIFGASVTVTTQNLREVTSDAFLQKLSDRGCKAVIFVEFVPVTDESKELAPGDEEREILRTEIERLREEHPEMVYIPHNFSVHKTEFYQQRSDILRPHSFRHQVCKDSSSRLSGGATANTRGRARARSAAPLHT